jgi:hypothetical protein
MSGQQRSFLTDDAALVPGDAVRTEGRKKINGHGSASCPPDPPFFGKADPNRIPHSWYRVAAKGGKRSVGAEDGVLPHSTNLPLDPIWRMGRHPGWKPGR